MSAKNNTQSRKPRRENMRPLAVVAIGVATLGVLIALVAIAANSLNGLPLRSYTTVSAVVPDIGNLKLHDEVRMRGLRVGQIKSARARGAEAVVELQLSGGTKLPVDTKAIIRGQGLLGQRYLELLPGESDRLLAEGAEMTAAKPGITFGVPDALQTFNKETRGALGSSVRELSRGVLGRGQQINDTLKIAPTPGSEFPRIVESVLDRGDAAERLLPSVRSGMTALDAARAETADTISSAAPAIRPFDDRREDLAAMIAEAPPTLAAAQPGLQQGEVLIASVEDLAGAVNHTLPDAPRALGLTADLLRQAPEPLRRLDSLLQELEPTVPAVLQISDRLSPVLRPLRKTLRNLTPIVAKLGQHGCDIVNFGGNWRSTLSTGIPAPDGGAELPSGRIGPLGIFRITALANLRAVQGASAAIPLPTSASDPYPRPCKYAPGPVYSDLGSR